MIILAFCTIQILFSTDIIISNTNVIILMAVFEHHIIPYVVSSYQCQNKLSFIYELSFGETTCTNVAFADSDDFDRRGHMSGLIKVIAARSLRY